MQKGRTHTSRGILNPTSDVLPERKSLLNLFNHLLLLMPAFFYGCSDLAFSGGGLTGSGTVHTKIAVLPGTPSGIKSLDIFFFDDDRLQRLDSYQRIDSLVPGTKVDAASGAGRKILVVLANSSAGRYEWCDINSIATLSERRAELSADSPDSPVMSAVVHVNAGMEKNCDVVLRPLLGQVVLSSISCDFRGMAYEGAVLEDVKVYLTNVSSSCSIVSPDSSTAKTFINAGRLSRKDFEDFASPHMLFSETGLMVGTTVMRPETTLYCYPNAPEEEGIGSPRTRMVIEGKIDGRTYYYPVDIGDGSVRSGTCYRYDVTITRRGTDDPDIPAAAASMALRCRALPWEEKETINITY